MKLAVLASHGGTVLQAIIDACENGDLAAEVVLVVSNNSKSMALVRAGRHRIPSAHLSAATAGSAQALDEQIAQRAQAAGADWIMLAGYMKQLTAPLLNAFPDRIVNTHPALLPRHGGAGCYGRRVHEAVHRAGDRETGATMHLVSEDYDRGRILAQAVVPVLPGDSVDDIEANVKEAERALVVDTLQRLSLGQLR